MPTSPRIREAVDVASTSAVLAHRSAQTRDKPDEEDTDDHPGGVAVATARQTGTGTYNDYPVPSGLRVTIVLTEQAGAWRLALIHMCCIAGTPGAPPIPGSPGRRP